MNNAANQIDLLVSLLVCQARPEKQFCVRVDNQTVYNGYNPYADFNANNALTTRFLYGNGIDTLIARLASGSSSPDYYLTDNIGSVRQIVGANGAMKDAINYSSFGKVLTETNPAQGDRFKYAGMEYEPVIDLSLAGFRYYDANTGRFSNEDPIAFNGGDANLYRYVGNGPVGSTDPMGLEEIKCGEDSFKKTQEALEKAKDGIDFLNAIKSMDPAKLKDIFDPKGIQLNVIKDVTDMMNALGKSQVFKDYLAEAKKQAKLLPSDRNFGNLEGREKALLDEIGDLGFGTGNSSGVIISEDLINRFIALMNAAIGASKGMPKAQ